MRALLVTISFVSGSLSVFWNHASMLARSYEDPSTVMTGSSMISSDIGHIKCSRYASISDSFETGEERETGGEMQTGDEDNAESGPEFKKVFAPALLCCSWKSSSEKVFAPALFCCSWKSSSTTLSSSCFFSRACLALSAFFLVLFDAFSAALFLSSSSSFNSSCMAFSESIFLLINFMAARQNPAIFCCSGESFSSTSGLLSFASLALVVFFLLFFDACAAAFFLSSSSSSKSSCMAFSESSFLRIYSIAARLCKHWKACSDLFIIAGPASSSTRMPSTFFTIPWISCLFWSELGSVPVHPGKYNSGAPPCFGRKKILSFSVYVPFNAAILKFTVTLWVSYMSASGPRFNALRTDAILRLVFAICTWLSAINRQRCSIWRALSNASRASASLPSLCNISACKLRIVYMALCVSLKTILSSSVDTKSSKSGSCRPVSVCKRIIRYMYAFW